MIVFDSSVVVEMLRASDLGDLARERWETARRAHVPQLMAIESLQVIRRWVAAREISVDRAHRMIALLRDMPVERHDHEVLLSRIFDLRGNLTAYDATYVALAESLDAPLLTLDARLAAAPGHYAAIELIG